MAGAFLFLSRIISLRFFSAATWPFFNFSSLSERLTAPNWSLVVIKQSNTATNLENNILRVKESAPDVAELFSDFHPLVENRTIDVNGNYGVISFCTETHFLARSAADQLNVDPIFFVSEYEPDFHAPGSLKTFTRSTFDLPHIGLYNTRKLYEYLNLPHGYRPASRSLVSFGLA